MFTALLTFLSRWFGLSRKIDGKHEIEETTYIEPIPFHLQWTGAHEQGASVCAPLPNAENLLDRSRTQWQRGEWASLGELTLTTIQHHPERAKLALLAAAGLAQQGKSDSATQFIRQAVDWGCSKQLVKQILIAGVHNSLGRAAAVAGQEPRARKHFENAIVIGRLGAESRLLIKMRVDEQVAQLGLGAPPQVLKPNHGPSAVNLDENPSGAIEVAVLSKYQDFSSAEYWEERYRNGGTSGHGSYGHLADFKAAVINKFIADKNIQRLIEFGCGDGNQLDKISVVEYIGVDVSATIVDHCRQIFKNNTAKKFYTTDEFLQTDVVAQLTLSLDVIFHLTENDVFEKYMNMLFSASVQCCIIYACDEACQGTDAVHVRRRNFTKWVATALPNWRLMQVIYNKYPHDGSRNSKDTSFSNFYFYERIM